MYFFNGKIHSDEVEKARAALTIILKFENNFLSDTCI